MELYQFYELELQKGLGEGILAGASSRGGRVCTEAEQLAAIIRRSFQTGC